MSNKSAVPASEEMWGLVKATQENLKDLSASQKETGQQIKELHASQKETDQQIKELHASQKETDQQIKELHASQKETDQQIKFLFEETNKIINNTAIQMQKSESRFNTRWGALVESLVKGKLVELFQERGIDIMQIHRESIGKWKKADGSVKKKEFDSVIANGREVVVVEVKSTLSLKDIHDFLGVLPDFKKYFPRYKTETVYGAVAYLNSHEKSPFFAEEKGLFVIRATGDSASIINKKDFKPIVFA